MARGGVRLVGRDKVLLSYLVRYKAATREQIQRELFPSASTTKRRIGKLKAAGLLEGGRIYYEGPAVYHVTAAGARLADEDLPAPRLDVTKLGHTLELVDLSWALRAGLPADGGTTDPSLHPCLAYFTERELRRDKLRTRREKGSGRMESGRTGHTPDGLLVLAKGEHVAIELELSTKRKNRYERIFDDYKKQRAAGEVDRVVWYFGSAADMRAARGAAHRRGSGGFCEFRLYRLPEILGRLTDGASGVPRRP